MRTFVGRVLAHRQVRHALAANERFNTRLGNQSAAGIAFFSVVAMVPVLMLVFAGVAMTLTVTRPDLLEALQYRLDIVLSSEALRGTVKSIVMEALQNWREVGIVGLASGLWLGAGWAKNIKRAIRAQMRDDYDAGDAAKSLAREAATNIGIAFVLLAAIAVTLGLPSGAPWLSSLLSQWLGLGAVSRTVVLDILAIAGSLVSGFGLFMFLLGKLPGRSFPMRTVVQGAAVGSVGVAVLQYLAAVIVGAFSRNVAATMFGPVIVVMLFLYLFATLVLMIAAWIATAETSRPTGAAELTESAEQTESIEPDGFA